MKCKDCAVSKLVECPYCDERVILCGEGEDLVEYKYWNFEDDVRCDGVIG